MAAIEYSTPSALGFVAGSLNEAVALAEKSEIDWPRDLDQALDECRLDVEAFKQPLGPTQPRGGTNGLIMRHGKVAASWGDVKRADFTFSIAKSYLALLAGIAVGDGLIRDLDDRVADYALDDGFSSPQNRDITWHHLLTQTSEWEGELFGKADSVDRFRELGVDATNERKGQMRELQKPGSYWEYNDVRVNRLSLALLQVFQRPLPQILAERIMNPIGASQTWQWHGYYKSQVKIKGLSMISVPGGTHWGGGLCINSLDHALLGNLVLNRGMHRNKRLLPWKWCEEIRQPCEKNPQYGYLWWLNTGREHLPSAPETSFFAEGAGGNQIWIDEPLGLVVVSRWLDPTQADNFVAGVIGSLSAA